jgi:hypothetical protein
MVGRKRYLFFADDHRGGGQLASSEEFCGGVLGVDGFGRRYSPALVLSSRGLRWRIAFALGLWVLLGLQFCLILVCLLAGFRE